MSRNKAGIHQSSAQATTPTVRHFYISISVAGRRLVMGQLVGTIQTMTYGGPFPQSGIPRLPALKSWDFMYEVMRMRAYIMHKSTNGLIALCKHKHKHKT